MVPTHDEVHVFYVHSPITYSIALATIARLQLSQVRLIGARGMAGGAHISHSVVDDGGLDVERTCQFLAELLTVIPSDQAIVFYLPHTVYLFGQLIKLSTRVRRFYYLEEGYTSAHPPLLHSSVPPLLPESATLLAALARRDLLTLWQIDPAAVALLHQTHGRVFDPDCTRYAGCFTCSADAFTGLPNVVRLPLPVNPSRQNAHLLSFGGVLNRISSEPAAAAQLNQHCARLLATAETLLAQFRGQARMLIKLHPCDGIGLPQWFYQQLNALGADYFAYCRTHALDGNAEPALHNFSHYHVVGSSAQSKYVAQLLGSGRLSIYALP